MNPDKIAIAMLMASQIYTLLGLRGAIKRGNYWRGEWERDSAQNMRDQWELLHWQRNAVLRNPKTGRYVKKEKHS
jgi:hypothetical protein